MRLSRPRFTVRRMMALVAVISLVFAGEVQRRRWATWSDHCREKARYHRAKAAGARGICIDAFTTPPGLATDEVSARYHDRMEQKVGACRSSPLVLSPGRLTDERVGSTVRTGMGRMQLQLVQGVGQGGWGDPP
jgi:hypothetical protein